MYFALLAYIMNYYFIETRIAKARKLAKVSENLEQWHTFF